MLKSKILSVLVVPLLLLITGLTTCLAVINMWSFEWVSSLIFVFSAGYILLFEQIIPLKKEWRSSRNELWPNVKHLLFSTVIFDALGKAFALSIVLWSKRLFVETPELWIKAPTVLLFLLAVIIGEFLPYLYHRISHEGKERSYLSLFLWRIHAIHHIPNSLNWFKTNWIHPINMLLNTAFKMAPLLLLGFSEDILFLVGVLHVVIAYISHANIIAKTGFLDYLIVTPKIHQFHHSKKMEEAQNFGNIIPFWDLVFGTYYNRQGSVEKVGVIKSKIEYPQEEKYWAQIAFPFRDFFKECCSE